LRTGGKAYTGTPPSQRGGQQPSRGFREQEQRKADERRHFEETVGKSKKEFMKVKQR